MAVASPDQPQRQFRVDPGGTLDGSPAVHHRPLLVPPAGRQAPAGLLPLNLAAGFVRGALGQQLLGAAVAEPELLEPVIRFAVVVVLAREPQRPGQVTGKA